MEIAEEIKVFHQRINYNLVPLPISVLQRHGIHYADLNEVNKKQIKIRAFHFTILSAKRNSNTSAMIINREVAWQEISDESLYYEEQLKEFALQCLHLTCIPLGECVVQRCGKKDLTVCDIRPLEVNELTVREKELIELRIRSTQFERQISFGADLELMIRNTKTNKYLNGEIILINRQIGFDDAIAIYNHRVFRPIVEVRPRPSISMEQLHNYLLSLYRKLVKEAAKYHFEIVTSPNPTGRFFLGGHIHFGNVPYTFQHVLALDRFLAIPFSIVEKNPSIKRRNLYGRLGSVRANAFNGFEYRVLPTWFQSIPDVLPVLKWVEFIIKNAQKFPISAVNEKDVMSYYQTLDSSRKIDEWIEENKGCFQEKEATILFNDFVDCLKKLQ